MTRYEIFRKAGARYATVPVYTCTDPRIVFFTLAQWAVEKATRSASAGRIRITRRRSPVCGSFEEITVFYTAPSGDRSKIVFTVPA